MSPITAEGASIAHKYSYLLSHGWNQEYIERKEGLVCKYWTNKKHKGKVYSFDEAYKQALEDCERGL